MRLTETYDNLIEKLKTKEQYFDENGDLLKSKVIYDSQNDSEEILELLLSDVKLSNTYFKTVKDTKIFLKDKFINTINHKEFFPSSYTSYLNYIGLSDGTDFIKKSKDVVLNFPYKDCILEGGQSKEEQSLKEFFYNETLANDEVDRLLHPKVFTNIRKYTKDGVEENPKFKHTDNLLIKGNNLIALHSLVKRYEGRVQLIYIDPPYNTENDSFEYNDKFNHSSWLTFMRNRLEIANRLLSENGSIYIQLDYNEVHYFKVLMDEVFGKENFQREIIWDINVLSGYKTMVKNWIRGHDSILFYSKNPKGFKFNKLMQPHTKEYEEMFNKIDEDGRKYMVAHKKIRYWDETRDKGKPFGDVWGDIMSFQQQPTSKERLSFSGQKPEKLLERIILSATDENDIVLDFFGGTGTTASVAMKLKRQFITTEQMEYIDTTLKNRLINTIEGDDSVLSKEVEWKGGGSFIYMELMKNNQSYIDTITECTSSSQLIEIKNELKNSNFIRYEVKDENLFDDKNQFDTLPMDEKKEILIKILDKNHLYVNYSEMDDTQFDISDEVKKFNREFYEVK